MRTMRFTEKTGVTDANEQPFPNDSASIAQGTHGGNVMGVFGLSSHVVLIWCSHKTLSGKQITSSSNTSCHFSP